MPFISRTHARVAVAAIAVLTVAGLSAGFAQNSPTDEASAAGANLVCDQNTLYGITAAGDVIQINATSGAATAEGSMSPATNALAITPNGQSAWAFENDANTIVRYNPVAGTSTTIASPDPDGNQKAIRGAVNPANGIYYYAGNGGTARIAAYDTLTGTALGQIGSITGLGTASGNNGDMAFGSDGTLYVVDADKVFRVSSVPSTAGAVALPATEILSLPSGTNSPGIALSSDGYLFLAERAAPTIYKINPSSGVLVDTLTISTGQEVVDLATCNYSNSLSGQADVRSRAASTDQFTITTTGNGISSGNTATTTGTTTGIQSAVAGPNLTVGGASYTVTQTAANTTNLANYSVGWTCVNRSLANQVVASGTGNTATFTNPTTSTADGTDVVCTFLTALLPQAVDDSYTTPINTTRTVNAATGLLANDTGATIAKSSNTAPAHGTVTVQADGSFSYVPTNGFTGTDTFDYTIADANGTTSTATATIQVSPVATNDNYTTPADTPLNISDLTANDGPTTMTVQSVTAPAHGTATLNGDGTVTYTPDAAYTGPDSFSYTAADAGGQTTTATVAITVAGTAADDAATGAPNTPSVLTPLSNDTPTGGSSFDPATLRIFDAANSTWGTQVTEPAVGTWEVVGSELQFTPVAGYSGNAAVQYRVTDTASNTVTATAAVFYPPTLALAYTNVDRAGLGVWGAGIGGLLLGLTLLVFSKFQRYHRPKRRPRHRAAIA